MSKPTSRPVTPGRQPSVPAVPVPPNARKASAPIVPGPARQSNPGPSPKFYNGPTEPLGKVVPAKAKEVAANSAAVAKEQSKRAVKTVQRHPWSIISLLTTIPFLLFASTFSTVICPPPSGAPSRISSSILEPFGWNLAQPPQGSFRQSFCYPANVYHDEVLVPYVYPIINELEARAQAHPIYVKAIEPGYKAARETTEKAWRGPVKPVVDRVVRGARKLYLTFVQPHIPYLRTKVDQITAPYTSRVAALHRQYLHPQLASAQLYGKQTVDRTAKGYRYLSSHPLTETAGRYANTGYRVSKQRGYEAYRYGRPHAVRFGKEVERVAREIFGPRVVSGLEYGGHQAARGWAIIKAQLVQLYTTHLDPHVGPHIHKASVALSPYAQTLNAKVYQPYIRPALESFLPAAVFAPEPPKSFWSLIADFLPAVGSHAAERKGSMDDSYAKVKKDVKTQTASAKSKVSTASRSASASVSSASASVASAAKKGKKMDRAEMDRVRENLKARIEEEGKKGYKKVKNELLALHKEIIETKMPILSQGGRNELETEINYITSGLDKLYSKSTVLTRDQVIKAAEMADGKFARKVNSLKARLDQQKERWHESGKPIVRSASDELDKLVKEKEVLGERMSEVNDLNGKDWTRYLDLQTSIDAWKDKYAGLHNGTIKDRDLLDISANIPRHVAELKTGTDDLFEGFRERINLMKKTALERIAAKETLSSESNSATASRSSSSSASVSPSSSSSSSTAESCRVSILPIAEAAAAAGVAGDIIGKGKEQVQSALSQASAAVAGEPASTASGVVESVKSLQSAASVGVSSILDDASSSLHTATRSIISAVGATPSPESPGEHAESIANLASDKAQSAYAAAGEAIHDATRSLAKAVGATPSPESVGEHARSIVDAAGEGVGNLASGASEAVHSATRSIASAVGATPSPENAQEHLESIANVVAQGAASAYQAAGDGVHQATRSLSKAVGATPSPEGAQEHLESIANVVAQGAASVYNAAGDSVHQATRSIISAAGATPSPESAEEYLQSVADRAGSLAEDALSSASSVGAVVIDAVHDGTRSAMKAVGATPSPESPAEHAQSLASGLSASAASIASAASSALHDGTRSAIRAVGATPSPETPGEYVESIVGAATSNVGSAYEAAASSASSVYSAAAAQATDASAAIVDQAAYLASQISEYLAPSPTPTSGPIVSYLSALSAAGSSAGTDLLSSGSSILASLSTQVHHATRTAAYAVGATPSPEGLQDRLDEIARRIREVEKVGARIAGAYVEDVKAAYEDVEEGVRNVLKRDEL